MENEFLLQIMPKEFRLYDALNHLPDGTREIMLNDGKKPIPRLRQGRRVYLWDGGEGLVGRGIVLLERDSRPMPRWQLQFSTSENPHPDLQRAVIRVDLRLNPPLSQSRIHQDAVLVKKKFFKNATNIQGAVFYVDSEAAEALERLIRSARRPAGVFADEIPSEYLDVLSQADQDGSFDLKDDEDARRRLFLEIAMRQGQPRF